MPNDFSGCLFPKLSGGDRGVADLLMDQLRFQGSHTQNASMVPTFMLATICAGGDDNRLDVLVRIDAAGGEPIADPQIVGAGPGTSSRP